MEKVKVHRMRPSLDMTPMVDLAFLLVTFFMLTTQFVPEEPLRVDVPSSVSQIKLPENDLITISISKEGRVFFHVDGKYTRQALLKKMGEKYQIPFNENEESEFGVMASFGVPMGNLKTFLDMKPSQRKEIRQPGIPVDSLNNELADWVVLARVTNPNLRVAIKGDQDTEYPVVKKVIRTLTDNRITRFNLITHSRSGVTDQEKSI